MTLWMQTDQESTGNKQKHVRGSDCSPSRFHATACEHGRARAAARGVTFDGGWFWIVSWRCESSPELLGGERGWAVGGG